MMTIGDYFNCRRHESPFKLISLVIIFIYLLTPPWINNHHYHLIEASWEQWWTYEGISGPSFWGRLNPKWSLCTKGRRQSPIDIDPESLLFDPFLAPLQLIGDHVNGNLINMGRGIVFKVTGPNKSDTNNEVNPPSAASSSPTVSLTAGPLTYRYTLNHFSLHYGRNISKGSEHTIGGIQFPGEIQFYAYNSLLYDSYEEASLRAHGVVAVSVLLQLSHDPKQANNQLKRITHALKNITTKGSSQKIESLSITEIMPEAMRRQYLTYEGSLTEPGCYETVQWIILNKPIYMTSHLFHSLQFSSASEPSHGADNYRPIQRLNSRPIRTNINFPSSLTESNQADNEFVNEKLDPRNELGVEKLNENDVSLTDVSTTSTAKRKGSCSMRRSVTYRVNTPHVFNGN